MTTPREKRLAEVGAWTDEQIAAWVIDSLQTGNGLVGMLRTITLWVRDIRDAEALKLSKGAAVASGISEGDGK